MVINQKEEAILLHIKNIFGVGSVNKGKVDFFYANGSFKSNSVTVDCFNAFPLKSKKHYAFLKLSEIRAMLLEKNIYKKGVYS